MCIFAIITLLISIDRCPEARLRAEVISLPIITDQHIDREILIRRSELLQAFQEFL
ncbi:MAG: hypothetical protein ACPK85_00505 [Methanosarcina sp.]